MKEYIKLLAVIVSTTLVSCSSNESNNGTSDSSDNEEIKALVTDYATSISNADTALASRIWANTDEVSFIHPRGHEIGWDSIKTKFYLNTMGSFFYQRSLTVQDLSIHARKTAAWVTFSWGFKAKFKQDSTDFQSRGRESQTYIQENNKWKLVQAHYSNLPITGPEKGM